jgi:lysophospholipase L1-like esterase
VPNPALVLIMTIDNDLRCDGTDPANVAAVGDDLRQALDVITQEAPAAQIVLAGSVRRPAAYVDVLEANPQLPRLRGMGGPCDLFDAAGNRNDAGIATVTGIVDAYEAEMAAACAEYATCDDALESLRSIELDAGSFSQDVFHPSIEGHREIAEAMWPRVAELLGVG